MKNLFVIICLLVFSSVVFSAEYTEENTQSCDEKNEAVCDLNGQPITGKLILDLGFSQREINYTDGIENGVWKEYDQHRNLMQVGDYKKGKKVGIQKSYYNNGILAWEMNYKDGLVDGSFKEYYGDGKLKTEGVYILGNRDGCWKEYDRYGNVIE